MSCDFALVAAGSRAAKGPATWVASVCPQAKPRSERLESVGLIWWRVEAGQPVYSHLGYNQCYKINIWYKINLIRSKQGSYDKQVYSYI
jgi:hypothetical protein